MKAVNVTASASSSGDVECYVTGSLTAKASSSGEVAYKGNPKDIDFSPKEVCVNGIDNVLMLQYINVPIGCAVFRMAIGTLAY